MKEYFKSKGAELLGRGGVALLLVYMTVSYVVSMPFFWLSDRLPWNKGRIFVWELFSMINNDVMVILNTEFTEERVKAFELKYQNEELLANVWKTSPWFGWTNRREFAGQIHQAVSSVRYNAIMLRRILSGEMPNPNADREAWIASIEEPTD